MTTLALRRDPTTFDALMRVDLMSFVHRAFIELNPSQQMSYAPHLRVISAKLQATLLRKGPRRLIISLPPRSLKSITASVAAVAFLLGHDPTKQIICTSYGQELADKHARDTRALMSSSFYKQVFPGTQLSSQKLSVNDFATTKQGFRMATSVGGVLTGRGGDVLIIDDPLKPGDALSETRRSAVNEWYDNTLLSRLNNKEDGIIIIVMQRLHQDDLIGHVLEQGEEWEVLYFPAIAEKPESYVVKTAIGPYKYQRRAGEVLDPSRESLETLLGMKSLIGSYTFESQYQQNPRPVGGNMVKKEWLQYYDPASPLPHFTTKLQSWDTANKSGELNDWSVCTTWGVLNRTYYLLDVFRQRLDYPNLRRHVLEQMKKHDPRIVIIEDRASGTQLIQDLKIQTCCRIRSYDPPPQTDKIMRLNAQTAHFEAGNVILPSHATWLSEYERELTSFPGAKHDDQVDSTTQALDYMSQNRSMEIWTLLGKR